MPSIRYMNQTAPFWDFVASLEEQGNSHPFFATNQNRGESSDNEREAANPWEGGWGGFPFGPGRWGPHHHHRHGHGHRGAAPPPPPPGQEATSEEKAGPSARADGEKSGEPGAEAPPSYREGPSDGPGANGPETRRGGRCGGRGGRGAWGGRGRGFGGPAGFPMGGGPFNLNNLAEMFQSQIFGDNSNESADKTAEDFKPEVDVFDTETAYVVHASLPGAKKEDIGVNWDAEKSELSIAGVVYRPADEEMLKALALDERKVGAFERKVRLGSRANPAQVDVDAITARMEDGVLRVDVPKLDSGYVEIKKVDIE